MDHLKRVTEEFTRQTQTFATWAEKVDADVGARFGGALGEAARGRLIDIACGPGVVTAALAPNANSVVAFDATDEMLAKAKARCAKAGLSNVEFKSGDAEHLPFADAQFGYPPKMIHPEPHFLGSALTSEPSRYAGCFQPSSS